MREKDKLLVTSNFSFSHNIFYPTWHLFFRLNSFKMSLPICFTLDQSKILSSGNGQCHLHLFQLYSRCQCTYQCFILVLFTSTLHHIFFQATGCFPIIKTMDSSERGMNPVTMNYHQSSVQNIGRAGDRTSNLLFTSPVHY